MENSDLLNNIISGAYSDWLFKIIMPQILKAIWNNIEFLFMVAWSFTKFSGWTNNKWDDSWAASFTNFLNKFRPTKKDA